MAHLSDSSVSGALEHMNGHSSAVAELSRTVPGPKVPALSLGTQHLLFAAILVAADALALAAALRLSHWIRFGIGITVSPEVVPDPMLYPKLIMLFVPSGIVIFALFGLYQERLLLGGVLEYARVFQACSAATMIIIIAAFVEPQFVVSRLWVLAAWPLSFLAVSTARFVCRRLAYAARERGYLLVPGIVVGTNQEALALAAELRNWRASGLRLVGFVATRGRPAPGWIDGLPVLGHVGEIREILGRHKAADVIVAITSLTREELLRLCEDLAVSRSARLRLSSGLYELLTTGVRVSNFGSVPLISLNEARLEPRQRLIKAVLEHSLALLALTLLSPLLLAIALLIRLDSPGAVIHRRRVMGVSGRQFDAFKFRTMHVDGEALLNKRPDLRAELSANHKLKQDPRITRVGRLLRRYSLDELPQLVNVLLGQMSLVGPRMITAEEAEKYGRHKLNLLTVKPGITGFWQVNGRSDLTYEERVNLDMYYIRNYSVWLDLQILFVQTLPAVIRGRGAY
jgi:exopolysaccharide biosynthesis polyprenyl glycosylphosphotransferase